MTGNIKAIETVYNNYQFQTRLEAQWAVFFDTLQIEYRYEGKGWEIEGPWRPGDFWLPGYYMWFEITGTYPDREVIEKAKLLSGGRPVIIAIGTPSLDTEVILVCGGRILQNSILCICSACRRLALKTDSAASCFKCITCKEDNSPSLGSVMMQFACEQARQARFEGEGNI